MTKSFFLRRPYMAKTTVKSGNSHYSEGGRMPSTTGKPSGSGRGNNPPARNSGSNHSGTKASVGKK